jgi:ribosomal RNA-processing protein 12
LRQNSFFKAAPEILLCLKDTNAKTRAEAMDLLIAMASKNGIETILQHVTAALGAQTTHMRSAAVLALSRLVYEFAWDNVQLQSNLPSLLTTVLVLIDANSREVIRSVIGFIRVSVAAIPPEQLEPLIPELVDSLTRFHKPKNRFRSKIKIILKKLVKLFGFDALMPHVPESESRLLTHMRKVSERQARKKEANKAAREDITGFDDLLESDEEDSDDGRTFTSGTTRKTTALSKKSRASGKTKGSAMSEVASGRPGTGIRLPSDATGEVVDMLGVKHTRHVQFAEDKMMEGDSDSDGALEFDDDGRLIVREEVEKPTELVENLPDNRSKRRRLDSNASKSLQGSKSQKSNQLGSNYKAKKAGGDVKRKGQTLEPYAYVPLDGRQYSKKNRHNAVNQMSSVVRNGGKRKR